MTWQIDIGGTVGGGILRARKCGVTDLNDVALELQKVFADEVMFSTASDIAVYIQQEPDHAPIRPN